MDKEKESLSLKNRWSSFTREQKIGLVVVVLVGFFMVGISTDLMRANIWGPFFVPNVNQDVARQFFLEQQELSQELAQQRLMDSDSDGLSDYDELYAYQTSPYLADSDSDGLIDSIEIAQGGNPNCPIGRNCFQAINDLGLANASSGEAFLDLLDVEQVPTHLAGEAGIQAFLDAPPEPDSMTAQETRIYLVETGLTSAEDLSLLTDELVKEVYTAAYEDALRIHNASNSESTNNLPGEAQNGP